MTGRERVLAALDHRQPDKVAIDFGGHRSSGIAAMAYPKLRQALGLPPRPVRVYDPIQQLAIIDDDVLDRFQVDTIELGRGFALEEKDWPDWTLPDGTPCQMPAWALPERQEGAMGAAVRPAAASLAKMPDGAIYFEQCYWPFLENDDLDALPRGLGREHVVRHAPRRPGRWWPARTARACWPKAPASSARRTDRAIIGLFGGNLLEIGQFLYRNDNFLMLLAGNPRRAHEFLDRLVEIHLANLERYLGAVGPYIDIIVFGDDLGMQNGPQMSPAMYREFFKPRHAKMWRRAKELADVKVMLHCCGGVRPLLPDLIEAGLDAINPGADLLHRHGRRPALKRDFGDRLDLLGRRLRHAVRPLARHARRKSAGTSASRFRSSPRAAASSSSRSTTSWPTCRRRTSSPCSTRPTKSASMTESRWKSDDATVCPLRSPFHDQTSDFPGRRTDGVGRSAVRCRPAAGRGETPRRGDHHRLQDPFRHRLHGTGPRKSSSGTARA